MTFSLLGMPIDSCIYFHSHTATHQELELARSLNLIFEIDLAWAHETFNKYVKKGTPYIGHPEEFYTKMGRAFPEENVSLEEFQSFLRATPSIKVLIDVKDEAVFPYLEEFVKAVGSERCIVHAFIKNWTHIPAGIAPEPHWHREDIDLFALDEILAHLGVPLIANCRGFSDDNVIKNGLIHQMIEDAKSCQSIVSLGLYYPGAPLPKLEFLQLINQAGYFAWVNGNVNEFQEKIGSIKYIAMYDDMRKCTKPVPLE